MNIKILASFFLFCFFLTHFSSGQGFSSEYSLRYESFAMHEIQEIQESLNSQYPVKTENIVNMPSRLTHYFSVSYYVQDKYSVGIIAGYGSTGSRYYYEDYSGYISNDFITNRVNLSMQFSYYHPLKWADLIFRIEPGFNFSTLKIQSETLISRDYSEDNLQFNSVSTSFRPGIGWRKNLKRFFIEGVVLYEINLPSRLLLSTNSDFYLQKSNGSAVDTNWSGLKLNLTVGIMLF